MSDPYQSVDHDASISAERDPDDPDRVTVEFITARLDEDEAEARETVEYEDNVWETAGWFPPSRVLAQVEAMRRIMDEIVPAIAETADQAGVSPGGLDQDLLRILATIWSTHPDFAPAWRSSPE